MDLCGSGPMRLRFPIMGHDFGPGGRFSFRPRRRRERRIRARAATQAAAKETQVGASINSKRR